MFKVRQKDIDAFLDTTRTKFVGYKLPDDHHSLIGLPASINEGVHVLNQVSLQKNVRLIGSLVLA